MTGRSITCNNNGRIEFDRQLRPYGYLFLPTAYCFVPQASYLNYDFTITVWVKIFSSGDYDRICHFASSNGYCDLVLHNVDGRAYFEMETYRALFFPQNINSYNWYHIAISLSGYTRSIYMDGILVGTGSINNLATNLGTTIACIGGVCGGSNTPMNGYLSEFRIFNRALGSTEIVNEMNNRRPS